MRTLIDIFLAFFRVGMLGYGGGPSSIPLVHQEVVKKYRWMNDDEFGDTLALGNALPGPIATKMAGYIGYRVKGITGGIVGVLALTLPTIVLMIALLTWFMAYKDSPVIQGMTNAVRPVVGVMLASLAYDFFKKSWKGQAVSVKRNSVIIGLISLIVIVFLGWHPAFVIGGILLFALLKKNESNSQKQAAGGKERKRDENA